MRSVPLFKHVQNLSKICAFSISPQEMVERLRPSLDRIVASKKVSGRSHLTLKTSSLCVYAAIRSPRSAAADRRTSFSFSMGGKMLRIFAVCPFGLTGQAL